MSDGFAYLDSLTSLDTHYPISVRQLILLCHPITQTVIGGTGISTCCPSPTPFGLGLGPD